MSLRLNFANRYRCKWLKCLYLLYVEKYFLTQRGSLEILLSILHHALHAVFPIINWWRSSQNPEIPLFFAVLHLKAFS